jgi:hypothetical protein
VATLFHQFSFKSWMGQHEFLGWLVTAAAFVLTLCPRSVLIWAMMLVLSILYTLQRLPFVPNHIFFECLVNVTVLLGLAHTMIHRRLTGEPGTAIQFSHGLQSKSARRFAQAEQGLPGSGGELCRAHVENAGGPPAISANRSMGKPPVDLDHPGHRSLYPLISVLQAQQESGHSSGFGVPQSARAPQTPRAIQFLSHALCPVFLVHPRRLYCRPNTARKSDAPSCARDGVL